MDDQFQSFWFAVELIATKLGPKEKVTDKCQRCNGDLKCESCGQISTHKAFPKQKIAAIFARLNLSSETIDELFKVRNSLSHGTEHHSIERELRRNNPDFDFAHAVDIIGNVARRLIIEQHQIGTGSHLQLYALPSFVSRVVNATAYFEILVPGDPSSPNPNDVRFPKATLMIDGVAQGRG